LKLGLKIFRHANLRIFVGLHKDCFTEIDYKYLRYHRTTIPLAMVMDKVYKALIVATPILILFVAVVLLLGQIMFMTFLQCGYHLPQETVNYINSTPEEPNPIVSLGVQDVNDTSIVNQSVAIEGNFLMPDVLSILLIIVVSVIFAFAMGTILSKQYLSAETGIIIAIIVVVALMVGTLLIPSLRSIFSIFEDAFAIILVIITAYYAILTRKLTMHQPRVEHSKQLQELLASWKNLLKPEDPTECVGSLPQENRYAHERDWRYQDFIKHHIPRNCNIKSAWTEYKELEGCYAQQRHDLANKLIQRFSANLGVSYDEGDTRIETSFISRIYTQVVRCNRDNTGIKKTEVQHEFKDNGLWYSGVIIFIGDRAAQEAAWDSFEQAMWNREFLLSYQEDVQKVVQTYNQLLAKKEEVSSMLDTLTRYPILPGTRCKWLKGI